MKYNFVYDTDFLEKNGLYLSNEEMDVVFATIVGKHNAIFYGYKPERLVKAIKKLTSDYPFVEMSNLSTFEEDSRKGKGGVLYTKDFDSWSLIDQQYLYAFSKNDAERCSQFIATTIHNPFATVVPDMINNFDIIYMCKEDGIHPFFKSNLEPKFNRILDYHYSLHSGHYVTSTELKLDSYWLFHDAYSYLLKLGKENPIIGRKVSMVSRSVSDLKMNSLTGLADVHIAEYLCGLPKKEVVIDFSEELW